MSPAAASGAGAENTPSVGRLAAAFEQFGQARRDDRGQPPASFGQVDNLPGRCGLAGHSGKLLAVRERHLGHGNIVTACAGYLRPRAVIALRSGDRTAHPPASVGGRCPEGTLQLSPRFWRPSASRPSRSESTQKSGSWSETSSRTLDGALTRSSVRWLDRCGEHSRRPTQKLLDRIYVTTRTSSAGWRRHLSGPEE